MAGVWLVIDETDDGCLACGADVQPGYHFCQACLDAVDLTRQPLVHADLLLRPVTVIECHPSDGPRLSACGYRLVAETVDPGTGLVKAQAWAKTLGD